MQEARLAACGSGPDRHQAAARGLLIAGASAICNKNSRCNDPKLLATVAVFPTNAKLVNIALLSRAN